MLKEDVKFYQELYAEYQALIKQGVVFQPVIINKKGYKFAKGGGVEDLEKELRKLQRDLNSSRLQTFSENDNSEEEVARKKEREVKLARFSK